MLANDKIRSPQDFCKFELEDIQESTTVPRKPIVRNLSQLSEKFELSARANCCRTDSGILLTSGLEADEEVDLPIVLENLKGSQPIIII